ncbi:MAG: 3-isopropylmalate dehydratase small subunit [Bacteroidota bacterium]
MQISATTIPLPIDNVDTDQIIPAKFLKQVDKSGYGKHLFDNWRFLTNGKPNPEFIFNKADRQGAKILIVGNNFGCGSSREHAAWAIADYGIKAIISTQFADIFKSNAYNNGILPIVVTKKSVNVIMQKSIDDPNLKLDINLREQTVISEKIGFSEIFDIHPFKKQCLLEGIDETEYLMKLRPEIIAFEKNRLQVT